MIATNYIERTTLPSTLKGNKPNYGGSKKRSAYFENITKDYEGSESIKNLNLYNGKYYKYLLDNNTSSTNTNIKAVAYMMDTSIWGDTSHNVAFEDSDWGDYVIGGPTIELSLSDGNYKLVK